MSKISGWTCITVEPEEDGGDERLPSDDKLHDLQQRVEQLTETDDAEEAEELVETIKSYAEELAGEVGVIPSKDQVIQYLQKNWDEDSSGSYGLTYDDFTFQHSVRGLGYDGGKSVAQQIFDECPAAGRVLIICANDTSDSGDGWLYERDEDGNAKLVDEKSGYEGCVGRDVQGYFREEHNISGLASPR